MASQQGLRNCGMILILMFLVSAGLGPLSVKAQSIDENSIQNEENPSNTEKTSPDKTTSPPERESNSTMPNRMKAPPFEPYWAQATGDNVNIRSGPGELYYPVGRLTKGQEVLVLEEKYRNNKNWAKIEPTAQCFCYIEMKFVKVQPGVLPSNTPGVQSNTTDQPEQAQGTDKSNPALSGIQATVLKPLKGTVIGNSVRVRAGSVKVPPAYANQVQTRLNVGAEIEIIGQRDKFYKIKSPKGCFFWVAMDFVKKVDLSKEQMTAVIPSDPIEQTQNDQTKLTVPLDQMDQERKTYFAILDMFKAEQKKAVKQRQYGVIKQKLEKLIKEAQSPSVQRVAQMLERNVNRMILAQSALQRSMIENEQLMIALDKIDNVIKLILEEQNMPNKKPEDMIIKGKLARSAVFTAPHKNRRYLLLDDHDRILYYAVAGRDDLDLEKWIGKPISLSGTVKFDAFGKTRVIHVSNVIARPN